ncbi:hypothetical protein OH76DRAFT_1112852 [Lentinus brumalis]|uniref:Uncharacterized protein n=1 Tax=Lentinus brumalis TaxID=2498619 RepID=A0A371CVE8_9APHY|nr:hypothetical protein OH76DRAFT_1112852 [Polyporus brumalis]
MRAVAGRRVRAPLSSVRAHASQGKSSRPAARPRKARPTPQHPSRPYPLPRRNPTTTTQVLKLPGRRFHGRPDPRLPSNHAAVPPRGHAPATSSPEFEHSTCCADDDSCACRRPRLPSTNLQVAHLGSIPGRDALQAREHNQRASTRSRVLWLTPPSVALAPSPPSRSFTVHSAALAARVTMKNTTTCRR